jgi:hypothetical protein
MIASTLAGYLRGCLSQTGDWAPSNHLTGRGLTVDHQHKQA